MESSGVPARPPAAARPDGRGYRDGVVHVRGHVFRGQWGDSPQSTPDFVTVVADHATVAEQYLTPREEDLMSLMMIVICVWFSSRVNGRSCGVHECALPQDRFGVWGRFGVGRVRRTCGVDG